MSLKDFEEAYEFNECEKNVVICVCANNAPAGHENVINFALEEVQKKLHEVNQKGCQVNLGFVYSDNHTCAKAVEKMEDGIIYYMDCPKNPGKVSHVWFLGMALLENKSVQDLEEGKVSENILILITNTKFDDLTAKEIKAAIESGRFENLLVKPVIIKSRGAADGDAEKYILNSGNGIAGEWHGVSEAEGFW